LLTYSSLFIAGTFIPLLLEKARKRRFKKTGNAV
jgi:hypothetical protein